MSLASAPEAVVSALADKASTLRAALLAKIDANLSGAVLQTRSGRLRASIRGSVDRDESGVSVVLESLGVPYAAIQEYGGRTGPHEIVALKAKALRFVGPDGPVYARHVHHPGSTIPERSYLRSALAAMRDEIEQDLAGAVRAALLFD